MYNALEAGLLSSTGINTWMPIATAANVAQGAAALAFAIKTKNRKNKSVAFPASLSAFLGITEPAIFGVNLRFMKPFVAGIIGGAAGGLVAGLLHVGASAYGITGAFGVLITTANLWQYLLVMAVAFAVAFLMTMVLYREKKPAAEGPSTGTAAPVPVGALADPNLILSPLSGTVVALKDVPDATFAEGVLGDGIAVEPSEGKVVAPCKGTVSTLFDTHHAIGLTLENGVELLVHIGINTVELNGEGYSAFVEEGDEVSPGQTLLTFDPDFLRSKGYQTVTPVIVTNSDEYSAITPKAQGQIQAMAPLLELGDRRE